MQELELVPLCGARIDIGEAIVIEGTPTGNLMVGEIADSRWEGERFRASQRGHAAADWLEVRARRSVRGLGPVVALDDRDLLAYAVGTLPTA